MNKVIILSTRSAVQESNFYKKTNLFISSILFSWIPNHKWLGWVAQCGLLINLGFVGLGSIRTNRLEVFGLRNA